MILQYVGKTWAWESCLQLIINDEYIRFTLIITTTVLGCTHWPLHMDGNVHVMVCMFSMHARKNLSWISQSQPLIKRTIGAAPLSNPNPAEHSREMHTIQSRLRFTTELELKGVLVSVVQPGVPVSHCSCKQGWILKWCGFLDYASWLAAGWRPNATWNAIRSLHISTSI